MYHKSAETRFHLFNSCLWWHIPFKTMIQQIKIIKIIGSVLISLAMLLVFENCGDKSTRANHIEDQIMKIHDSVMPKISYVLKLRSAIASLIETTEDAGVKDSLQAISYHLTKADREMMKWMHEYEKPDMDNDTAIIYLNEQLNKINEVSANIYLGIAEAEQVIHSKSIN